MVKRKVRRHEQELFEALREMAARSSTASKDLAALLGSGSGWSRVGVKMKKFRFQLLHGWLVRNLEPCRVADVGGGKGLLTYLLVQSGWQSTVVDPVSQSLPRKYRDIANGKRVRIAPTEGVTRVKATFELEMARDYDLLVGMHAHGCNAKIMDAAAEFGCGFVLFPCCVIDEPFYPRLGVHWLESVLDYAIWRGRTVYPFRLKFRGQNIGFYGTGKSGIRKRS
jgi:hypothetical protein